jgi:hypothetical protein
MRLFLQRFLVALEQALPDSQAGIPVGMVARLALWAQAKRRAGRVSLNRLALIVANDGRMTAMAFPARIARIDAAGDDTTCIPRLVLRVLENAPFHPVGAFPVAAARILAFFRAQVAEMLEDQYACLLLDGELDNAGAHLVRDVLIDVPDLAPQISIVLFPFGNEASLRSVVCNASEQSLPKARYRCAISNEGSSQDGAFDGLDRTHG